MCEIKILLNEMKILLNYNSILQVGIGPTPVTLQPQLWPLTKNKREARQRSFYGNSIKVKYFNSIPKEFKQQCRRRFFFHFTMFNHIYISCEAVTL